jgi:hypothetical protein
MAMENLPEGIDAVYMTPGYDGGQGQYLPSFCAISVHPSFSFFTFHLPQHRADKHHNDAQYNRQWDADTWKIIEAITSRFINQ